MHNMGVGPHCQAQIHSFVKKIMHRNISVIGKLVLNHYWDFISIGAIEIFPRISRR